MAEFRSTTTETADVLARFRDGDREAFDELVRAYERRLVQFFYRLCWDRDRAEELGPLRLLSIFCPRLTFGIDTSTELSAMAAAECTGASVPAAASGTATKL